MLANRWLIGGVLFELSLIAAIVYTPWGHFLFGTAPIGWRPWVMMMPFAIALLAADWIWKRFRCSRVSLAPPAASLAASAG